jgi:hypothetical protein
MINLARDEHSIDVLINRVTTHMIKEGFWLSDYSFTTLRVGQYYTIIGLTLKSDDYDNSKKDI